MKRAYKTIAGTLLAFFAYNIALGNKSQSSNIETVDLSNNAIRAIENRFGSIDSEQIEGIEEITKSWYQYGDGDLSKYAYILATAYWESKIRPVEERRAAQGTSLYETQNRYWFTGFYGRGYVQLTHESNYSEMSDFLGIDLVNYPDRALEISNAAKIIVFGMMNGTFTGRSLSDYINDTNIDFYNARRVVNGTDRADTIAGYADDIYTYLFNNQKTV